MFPIACCNWRPETVYLIRLNHSDFPKNCVTYWHHRIHRKLVTIRDDIKGLQQLGSFMPQGTVELSQLARQLGIVTCGLRNLAGIFLNVRISKKAQLSNWEQEELTESQRNYAATDAWISREIYGFLDQGGWLQNTQALNPEMEAQKQWLFAASVDEYLPISKPSNRLAPACCVYLVSSRLLYTG